MSRLSEKEKMSKGKSKWTFDQVMFLHQCEYEAHLRETLETILESHPVRAKSAPQKMVFISSNPKRFYNDWFKEQWIKKEMR